VEQKAKIWDGTLESDWERHGEGILYKEGFEGNHTGGGTNRGKQGKGGYYRRKIRKSLPKAQNGGHARRQKKCHGSFPYARNNPGKMVARRSRRRLRGQSPTECGLTRGSAAHLKAGRNVCAEKETLEESCPPKSWLICPWRNTEGGDAKLSVPGTQGRVKLLPPRG